MRSPLLMVLGFFALSLKINATVVTTSEDVLTAMLEDGCARPIVDNAVATLPALPKSCLISLQSGDGVIDAHILKRVGNWGSNGLGGKPWRFADDACNEFFVALHTRIAAHVPGMRLTPHDLFHGHMLSYGPTGRDHLAIVFHGKEYPRDLEIIKNKYQISAESFASTDEIFYHRNFLYLSHRDGVGNEIFLIEESGICIDYFSQFSVNSLSEAVMELVLENGKLLGDVNVFLPQALRRLKYQFYAEVDLITDQIIEDYEWIDSGKSVQKRLLTNTLLDLVIEHLGDSPLIYFLTGRA